MLYLLSKTKSTKKEVQSVQQIQMSSEPSIENQHRQDHDLQALTKEAENTSLKLESITDGANEHGVPKVLFVDDITTFAKSFDPPASAELMIGAFSDLFGKFKTYETSLMQKSEWNLLQTAVRYLLFIKKYISFSLYLYFYFVYD